MSRSAGCAGVAVPSSQALSVSDATSNSKYWVVTPSIAAGPPGAAVVIVPSTGACAGPVGAGSWSGTVSGASAGAVTTGTVTFVPSGPVKTDTFGSSANSGALSGSDVVTCSTSRWPARRWCAIAKAGGSSV